MTRGAGRIGRIYRVRRGRVGRIYELGGRVGGKGEAEDKVEAGG